MKRKIRMGMVGGGRGAFIGTLHRIAAAIDNEIELVCGAFSSDLKRSRLSGKDWYIAAKRAYGSYEEMFKREKALPENELTGATHFGLGTWIRNEFGLWDDDSPLMKELERASPDEYLIADPDSVSSLIIQRAWKILNSET